MALQRVYTLTPFSEYAEESALLLMVGFGPPVCNCPRTVPVPISPSSICVSTAMAILSGRPAEQTISPPKPPSTGAVVGVAPFPVCTPSMPVTALNGCDTPLPATNPARRRWSHQLQDSTAAVQGVPPLL